MYTTVVIGGIALIVALIGVAMWCCYRAGWDNGYEQANGDHTEAKHAARHAKTEPRRKPAETPLLTWDGGPKTKEPWPTWDDARREYERRQEARTAARTATTAAEIAPVVLPEPGTYLPQPGRDSGPGTVTFARLDKPATTGEMAAVTDQFLADMAVQEEQFRLGLAT